MGSSIITSFLTFSLPNLDLRIEEEARVIGPRRGLAAHLLVDMRFVDARHHAHALLDHEVVPDRRPIHGSHHLIEVMDDREVALHHHIGAARALHPRELSGQLLTTVGDLHPEDFHPEEMKG